MLNTSWRRAAGPARAAVAAVLLLAACGGDGAPLPTPTAPPPAPEPPPAPAVTAAEVVDRASLRVFVEAAVAALLAAASTPEEAYAFMAENFREPGTWRHEDIHLGAMRPDGTSFFHAADPSLEGQNLWDVQDLTGLFLVRELIAAAQAGGEFVRYFWENPVVEGDEEEGSPKVSFGILVTIGDTELVLGSGVYPPITAADALNRNLLRRFVERAAAAVEGAAGTRDEAYGFMDGNFRTPGEWRHEEIYLFAATLDAVMVFHGADIAIEGQDLWDAQDVNGVRFAQKLSAAAQSGGGFVEYRWDNPTVEGDEADGSPKVSYATLFKAGTTELAIGAGIYPE